MLKIIGTTAALAASLAAVSADTKPVGTMGSVTRQETVSKLETGSELVALYSEPAYVNPIYVLNLHGDSSRQQGFDAGFLFGKQFEENYRSLFHSLLGDYPKLEQPLTDIIELFLDWQWTSYLSVDVPQEYLDELSGLRDGGASVGVADLDLITQRGITLANLPGDVEDIIFLLIDEFSNSAQLTKRQRLQLPALKQVFRDYRGHQCSMFGVWGDRTQNGNLFSARNLDWLTDLGINQYKLLTVHHPPQGNSHVTVGFAGMLCVPLESPRADCSAARSHLGRDGGYVQQGAHRARGEPREQTGHLPWVSVDPASAPRDGIRGQSAGGHGHIRWDQ